MKILHSSVTPKDFLALRFRVLLIAAVQFIARRLIFVDDEVVVKVILANFIYVKNKSCTSVLFTLFSLCMFIAKRHSNKEHLNLKKST